jgi:hypothetical protein
MTYQIEAVRRTRLLDPRSYGRYMESHIRRGPDGPRRITQFGFRMNDGSEIEDGDYAVRGLLVTGYADQSDWLFAPTGGEVIGGLLKKAPGYGWARASDGERGWPLYILDFTQKSYREVPSFNLPNHAVINRRGVLIDDYDDTHLIVFIETGSDQYTEIAVIDIRTGQTVHRFRPPVRLSWHDPAVAPDGVLKIMTGSRSHRVPPGLLAVHPLTQEYSHQPLPFSEDDCYALSPRGTYLIRQSLARLPVVDLPDDHPAPADFDGRKRRYGHTMQLWSTEPVGYLRELLTGWLPVSDFISRVKRADTEARAALEEIAVLCATPRADPHSAPEATENMYKSKLARFHWDFSRFGHLVWQQDETAFWWAKGTHRWYCVGLDGRNSPAVDAPGPFAEGFAAKPGRVLKAHLKVETHYAGERGGGHYLFDGAPADDPHIPRMATVVGPAPLSDRHLAAQAALRHFIQSLVKLRVVIPSPDADDCIRAIKEIAAALDCGLKTYANSQGALQIQYVFAGAEYADKTFSTVERKFFKHVQSLGPGAVPSLRRLIAKCCADPDMSAIGFEEMPAFGEAAAALGTVDAGSLRLIAQYLMHVPPRRNYLQQALDTEVVKRHGWCDEIIDYFLCVIVQAPEPVRTGGRHGEKYVYSATVWMPYGLAAAAKAAFEPEAFAARMLAVRDWMVTNASGLFAKRLAQFAAEGRTTVYGCQAYDDLYQQLVGWLPNNRRVAGWDKRVFDELSRLSSDNPPSL